MTTPAPEGQTRPPIAILIPLPVLVATVSLLTLTATLVSFGAGLFAPLAPQLPADPVAAAAAFSESPVAVGARLTARATFVFFIAAYLARPLWERFRWRPAAWALRNRRWLGFAAALSHSVHLAYVVAAQYAGNDPLDVVTLLGGGLGFLLFWLMGITSNDTAVRRLGNGWGWLHRTGMHYLWFIFILTYAGAAAQNPMLAVFVVLLAGGALLRLANHRWPVSATATDSNA